MSVAHLRHSLSFSALKQFHSSLLNRFNSVHLRSISAEHANVYQSRRFHKTHYNSNSQTSKLTQVGQSTVDVKHYGCLHLNHSFTDLAIKPVDLDRYPNMDVATCSFLSADPVKNEFPVFSQNDGELSLTSSKVYEPSTSQCVVEIPLKHDVQIKDSSGKNNIDIRSLESTLIEILTESGNITSKSLKGDVIKLSSKSGSINCQGVTQGSISFQSDSGNIHGHRFQGPNLEIKTATGDISTESVYSDVSHFSSQDGNIHLKNLHRQCSVAVSGNGNLTISGMDGSLDAILGNGNHQIQISQLHDSSSIKVDNGVLTLKIPEQCPFGIRIQAKSLTVPKMMESSMKKEENGYTDLEYNKEQSSVLDIDATNSHVEVQFEDWLASLGLNWK